MKCIKIQGLLSNIDDFLMFEINGCSNILSEILCCRNHFISRVHVTLTYFPPYLDIFVIYKKLNSNQTMQVSPLITPRSML